MGSKLIQESVRLFLFYFMCYLENKWLQLAARILKTRLIDVPHFDCEQKNSPLTRVNREDSKISCGFYPTIA